MERVGVSLSISQWEPREGYAYAYVEIKAVEEFKKNYFRRSSKE